MLVRTIPPTGTYGDAGRNLPTSTNYFGVGSLHIIPIYIDLQIYDIVLPSKLQELQNRSEQ